MKWRKNKSTFKQTCIFESHVSFLWVYFWCETNAWYRQIKIFWVYIFVAFSESVYCSNISCTCFLFFVNQFFFPSAFFHQQKSHNKQPKPTKISPWLKSGNPKTRGNFPNGCHGYRESLRHRASGRMRSTVRDQDADQDREEICLAKIF